MPHDIHHRIHSVHVQVLSRESAYAHTFLALNMNEDGEGDFIEVRFSTMLVKQEDDWKVIGWHGMRARDHGFQAEIKREFDPQADRFRCAVRDDRILQDHLRLGEPDRHDPRHHPDRKPSSARELP